MQRFLFLAALVVVAEGCATAPILRKQFFDKTTALFARAPGRRSREYPPALRQRRPGGRGNGRQPPPLQRPDDIKAYADYMAQHRGEEYVEKDLKNIADRFCLNRRESLDTGDDRVFAIVWRGGRVFKRVIKGGPVSNPKQERALLICPGTFILDTVTGVGNKAVSAFAPFQAGTS